VKVAVLLALPLAFAVAEGQSAPPKADPAAGDDSVLRGMEAGLEELRDGRLDEAARRLDSVLNVIESQWADTESARRVRSLWYSEGAKAFRGEPYERVSAYFYRGVIHLLKGEYDDARVAFKAGTLQDAFAEEEQYRCDWGLLYYLYATCSEAMGAEDLARQAIQEALEVPGRPWHYTSPPPKPPLNVLLVETGRAPRKLADGAGHSALVYRRGTGFRDEGVEVTCEAGRRRYRSVATEDLFFQASTRGGRAVDRIVEGKVQFQKGLDRTGERAGALAGSADLVAVITGSNKLGALGGAIDLIGGISRLVAANAKPRVDTRQWASLPDRIHVVFLPASDSCSRVRIRYLDYQGESVPGLDREAVLDETRRKAGVIVHYVPSPTALWKEGGVQ
jgi:hypothetical protein